jgi:hypothetical protein
LFVVFSSFVARAFNIHIDLHIYAVDFFILGGSLNWTLTVGVGFEDEFGSAEDYIQPEWADGYCG